MKKYLLLGVISLFCLNAQAQSNSEEIKTYMSAKARYSLLDADVSTGGYDVTTVDEDVAGFGVAVGMSYKNSSGMLRTELEYNKNGTLNIRIFKCLPKFKQIALSHKRWCYFYYFI